MNARTPYLVAMVGLAGLSIVALHRMDALIFVFVWFIAAMTVTFWAWEAHRR